MPEDKKDSELVDDGLNGLTFKVIGLAMTVHTDLGPGHREATYHNAMTQRYADANLIAEYEPELPIIDENGNHINSHFPDHRVEQRLLVEYKAHTHALNNDEIAQCFDYFAASDCDVILLFNFGRRRLEWKRLFPPKQIIEHRNKKKWVNE